MAVPTRFNRHLDTLIVFSLMRFGYAIQGEAAGQQIFEHALPVLPEGLVQLYVPGLSAADVRLESYGSVKGF